MTTDDVVTLQQQVAQLTLQVDRLQAAQAVSACLHQYMQLCDELDEGFDLAPLLALFTDDAVWEGKGKRYAGTFGRCEGKAAVAAMFAKYTRPPAHFALNVHFLTSEWVEVDSADSARGRWVLLQTATFADGRSQLSSALLEVHFRRQQGRWLIARFCTTSRFNRPVNSPWDNPAPLPVPK
ncbi:nuclear transport factor 2 family protein [Pokkaliibacter sp. MBI-7]|uniref:nuclear transport factor 2 family protein n=1 Tax=Pokkaliibacter sp. MBI-7 TaxID=3040600 RepID=UPI00244B532A|nr:nuclear transport factor 2 family protein [Pokkaliibacter sp. MBI-7]MDH2431405.1 nuclear transport factor 2 family protein [Pokkaliibacter sp. MBI-7]